MLQILEKQESRLLPSAVTPTLCCGMEGLVQSSLQKDFALASRQLPNLKILTMATDQLGHWPLPPSGCYEYMAALSAREFKLDAQLWNTCSIHLERLSYEWSFVTRRLGAIISDAVITNFYREDPVPAPLQSTLNHLTRVLTPARHLVILLPPSEWGANRFTAEFLRLPSDMCCGDDRHISPQQMMFAHELGHGKLRVHMNMTYSSWTDELAADLNIQKHCKTLGEVANAAYALDLRTLSNFLAPATPNQIKYWNTLAQRATSRRVNPLEDVAAMLELKRQALGHADPNPILTTPEQIIRHAWGECPDLRMAGETLDSRLQLLSGLRHAATEAPLRLEATRTLAPHVLAAARLLTPQAV
jgi:hypothetical protein